MLVAIAMNVAAFLFLAYIALLLIGVLANILIAIFVDSEDAHYHRLFFGVMLFMLIAYLCVKEWLI